LIGPRAIRMTYLSCDLQLQSWLSGKLKMKKDDVSRHVETTDKIAKEIQEMVDELEVQARIAKEGGIEGLERHREEWFQKGYEHGLLIKKKYGIEGDDMKSVYKQCCAVIKDERDRTRIPEIKLENNVLYLRSRAGTYCPSLEAVKRKTGSYALKEGMPELCQYCKRAWFQGALQAAVSGKLHHKNLSSRIRGDIDCVETFYLK